MGPCGTANPTRRLALALPALLVARPAGAAWPERPVRLVAPFPAGSGTDILARLLAEPMARDLGQPVLVDNRPGGNGVVGAQHAATAAPDGHTVLILGTSAAAINPHTLRRLPYDPIRDFAPIGMIAEQPYVLAVHPESPARDLAGLLDLGRQRELTFGYGNAGGLIMGSMLGRMAGLQRPTPVPYRGAPEALSDVMSGRLDFTFTDLALGMAQVRGGRLRVLALSQARPFPLAPEVPTVASLLPDFDANVWWSLVAPAGVQPALVARLGLALDAALSDAGVAGHLAQLGIAPLRMSPAELGDHIRGQIRVWGERVRMAGIEPQ